MHIQLSEDAQINKQLNAFWEIKSLGITCEKSETPEDLKAPQQYEKSSVYEDGCYHVELPWWQVHPNEDKVRTKLQVVFNASFHEDAGKADSEESDIYMCALQKSKGKACTADATAYMCH